MANITCYPEGNYGGSSLNYFTDITSDGAVKSCKVARGIVTAYQLTEYRDASVQLTAGEYPNTSKFLNGAIASLKCEHMRN